MIIAIRISGQVNISEKIKEALFRLRLRKKYSAVILEETPENKKILQNLRNFISYGQIDDETFSILVEKRGKGKKREEIKVFHLHPPRKGIESKKHFGVGKGVLGENKKINELLGRMM
jgi:large subunit ribosomal protein L30